MSPELSRALLSAGEFTANVQHSGLWHRSLKQKSQYSRELSRNIKRVCSSCILIHLVLLLPVLSCFPSLCFRLSSPLSYSLSLPSHSLLTFLRSWVRREKQATFSEEAKAFPHLSLRRRARNIPENVKHSDET